MMKKFIYNAGMSLSFLFAFIACMKDDGNYNYNYDGAPKITIDTVGVRTEFLQMLNADWSVGERIYWEPNVKFENGDVDCLEYVWVALKLTNNQYLPEQVGNISVYGTPDTICTTKALDFTVDFEAGSQYRIYCQVSDPVTGVSANLKISNYIVIPALDGTYYGIYCLQEKDGRLDIDVLRSDRALILGNGYDRDIWSKHNESRQILGTPKFMWYNSSNNWFYIVTDQEMMRISSTAMQIMDTWDNGMFYETPEVYSPEAMMTVNNCDFLINNGKLHVLYLRLAGDRMFSGVVNGDYNLFPFLSKETLATWGQTTGAIDGYQYVYDLAGNSFRPYFNKATSLSRFNTTDPEAIFNVNAMQGTPVYINTINGGVTAAIMKRDNGEYALDIANFYNVVDDGNLARQTKSLNGCIDIDKATCFESGTGGAAIFYSVKNIVYAYSYTSGQTNSTMLWTGDSDEEVTCMRLLSTGGFPTSGRVLWIAVWNQKENKGRVIEFEIDPDTGLADSFWSGIFGIDENPSIHEDFGKVYSMIEKN